MAENFFGKTDTGRVRENNEDTFIAERSEDGKYVLACAIDGVGGYSGGEVAAGIARASILEAFKDSVSDITKAMKSALIHANRRIFEEKLLVRDHDQMACVLTLAIVDIANNQFYYAHVGDTRLYLLRDNSLVKLSKDHSFVGFLEDSGRIDESMAMKHLKRNEINKALGFGREIESQDDYIETGSSPFLPGDMLLLCSDGLTDMVNKDSITKVLTAGLSIESKVESLIEKANDNGGKDNITVVLVVNDKASKWQAAKPSPIQNVQAITPQEQVLPTTHAEPKAVNTTHSDKKSSFSGLTKGLLVICLLLTTLCAFLIWQNKTSAVAVNKVPDAIADTSKNKPEIMLQAAINSLQSDTLILSDTVYRDPIILSDTLQIYQDTLYIICRGKIVLKPDAVFKGPAVVASTDAKLISLEGIEFENFDIAITVKNDALLLKNVVFTNCKWPIQQFLGFPDRQYINGRLAGRFFFITDSLKSSER